MKWKNILSFVHNKKFQNIFLIVFFVFSLLLFASAIRGGEFFEIFKTAAQKNMLLGAIFFVLLEAISIVLTPVTTIFLIPVASEIFGPFLTALLSLLGWTIGSAIAFLLARRFGRPLLEKIVEPKKLEKYRNYISQEAEFLTVIVLRIMLPVDVLSYAIGLFTVMRFEKYILATVIGITPFSFVYAYGGGALLKGNYVEFLYTFGIAVIFLVLVFTLFKKIKKKH